MYNLRGYHPSRMERQALGKAGNEHMVLAVISFHYRTSPGPIAFALESWCTWSFVQVMKQWVFRLLFQFYQIVQLLGRRRYSYESGKEKKQMMSFHGECC